MFGLHLVSLLVGAGIGVAGSAVYSLAHSAKLTALGADIKAELGKAVTEIKSKV